MVAYVGRKAIYTKTELLDTTEKLLIEFGYEGFHMKLLSEHLSGARSTIYQYYANKEEVIAACLRRAMERIMKRTENIDESDALVALQELLRAYISEAKLHRLLGETMKVKISVSDMAKADVEFVTVGHHLLKAQLFRIMEAVQKVGYLRLDVPILAMVSLFFTLIETPNMLQLPSVDWADLLFKMWFEGVRGKVN